MGKRNEQQHKKTETEEKKRYISLTENIKEIMTSDKIYKTIKVEVNDIESKSNLLFADGYNIVTICPVEGTKVMILAMRVR